VSIPTQINVPQSPFNSPSRVYNGEGVEKKAFRYIKPERNETVDTTTLLPTRPQVLTDFAAVASDLDSDAFVVTDVTDTVPRTPIVGTFAAIRARRILHQYRIGFWSTAGIIDQITASSESDPSQTDIDNNWNNFQLFSYLPSQLMPTKEQFADLITPSKNASNVRNSLPSMGINTTVVTNPLPNAIAPAAASLPSQTPFASNLSQFCAP